jgi:type II secretory pathway pseudopilin PulG
MTTTRDNHVPHAQARRGFTLAELLVAVSVVIVLSIAMGQVFSAVGRLVGTGAAVSEVDQLARGIERQMRDDFDAFGRMKAEETFFAIRSRTLGDANNNGIVEAGNGEISLYLSQDDKDIDLRAGLANPYQRDAAGKQIGRGVTARLDEMVFLSRASEKAKFMSYQQGGIEDEPVLADVARIYYGHGLKPGAPVTPQGTEFDASKPLTLQNRPVRRLFPDTRVIATPGLPAGDATHAPTQQTLAWGRVFGEPFTRNEFASDFPLLRQPLLLYGGRAAGNAGTGPRPAPINSFNGLRRRTYAPYIRDLETLSRSNFGVASRYDLANGWTYPDPTFSSPRMLRWGRTDICAQDRDDVQRWLEGYETSDAFGLSAPQSNRAEASAFARGALEDSITDSDPTPDAPPFVWKQAATDFASPDAALMYRLPVGNAVGAGWGPAGSNTIANPAEAVRVATTRLRSAIAGVFTRLLCEPAATNVAPRINPVSGGSAAAQVTTVVDPVPADSTMDQHALLAPKCSNFEIAWSDGTTWNGNQPLRVYLGPAATPENLIATYMPGDIVWFDSVLTKRQYVNIPGVIVPAAGTQNPATDPPDPEVLPEAGDSTSLATTTPNSPQPAVPAQDRTGSNELLRRLNALSSPPTGAQYNDGVYDPFTSGGDPTEYLAIWGFRRPAIDVTSNGATAADQRMTLTWSESKWEKPKFIRVRMTLHDALNRIAGGKSFEYVFTIENAAN